MHLRTYSFQERDYLADRSFQACVRIYHADWACQHRLEDVHGEWVLGYHYFGPHRESHRTHFIHYSANPVQAVFWVETKGKTLEEIDALFEGEKHSSVPDVEMVRSGKEEIDVKAVELQLDAELRDIKSE